MQKRLIDYICCPVCKDSFELTIKTIGIYDDNGSVIDSGDLYCKSCNIFYPIKDGVPRLFVE